MSYSAVDTSQYYSATGNRFDGCRVYEFENLDTGTLFLDGARALVEVQRVDGAIGFHHGACETIDGLQGGIIYSQYEPDGDPETFRMYKSQVAIP
jgi:hypothetical protein